MTDALQLKSFYDTPEGHRQCRIIREKIEESWGSPKKEKIIGFGFTLPYLPPLADNNQLLAIMPREIGALDLHQGMPCVMADEAQLPVRNEVIDRIISAHALENIEDPYSMLAEFWRVLKPYGRVLFIFEREKFEPEKMSAMLLANKFYIMSSTRCVGSPEFFAGLNGKIQMVEAQKLVFAPRGRTQRVTKSILDKLLKPKPATEPEPQGV